MLNQPNFHEYFQFEQVLKKQRETKNPFWTFQSHSEVVFQGTAFPLWKVICEDKNSKKKSEEKVTLILTGGVHGLEKIGSQLCVSLIEKYFELSTWDIVFQNKLQDIRFVFFPFINPVGIQERTRSNGKGVDLMRNAPIEAKEKVPALAGGHRISNWLPWYRGKEHEPMQTESQFLVDEVTREILRSKFTLSLDIHSGFGFKDQIWFPWAFSKNPYPKLDFITAMMEYFEKVYPFHIYKIEPQSKVYCTHGDLWDYIAHERIKNLNYVPLTLELGSWIWVKKNPLQIFKLDGLFNPIKKHRIKRTLRRHQLLIDFMIRFLLYSQSEQFKNLNLLDYYNKGLEKWYPQHKTLR